MQKIYDENTTITGIHNKYISMTNNLSQLRTQRCHYEKLEISSNVLFQISKTAAQFIKSFHFPLRII